MRRPRGRGFSLCATTELWVYDFRTNQNFTLKTRPLTCADLDGFVAAYKPGQCGSRAEAENFNRWTYEQIAARPGFNLDIWADVTDESLTDPASLAAPEVFAAQIIEDTTAAIEASVAVAAQLSGLSGSDGSGVADADAVDAFLSHD